ncbi:acyltransferase [Solihabitans fulvus]|uniref:Acyltransferase n=1 Tax=Solihabitans fulvus TaxID=1892852 RepID=A0A5B2X1K5_9PSEU|nr:acyltransferase [Solihabitans fulvus]KAA2257085.1 acyltransferase [Solihabitans fulvus]
MNTTDGNAAVALTDPAGPAGPEVPITDTPGTTTPHAAEPAKPASHILQLTGVRALAASWVLMFHFRPELLLGFGFLHPLVPLMNVGYLGVDLFFVLSGFILTYTHLDRMIDGYSWKKMVGFLWLRFSRIWPLMFFMMLVWAAYLAFLTVHNNDGRMQAALNPERFLAHVFLVQAWTTTHHDWNPIDWSLSAEWMAYLAFTVFVVLFAKLRLHVSSRGLVLLALFSVLPVVFIGMGFQDGSDLLWNNDNIVEGIVPLRVLSEFAGGAIVSILVMRHGTNARLPWFLRPTTVFVVIIALLYLIPAIDPAKRWRYDQNWSIYGHLMWGSIETVVVVPLFLLLIGSLAVSRRDLFTRLLATRVLVWGGKVSFALYLVHWLYLDAMRRVLGNHLHIADRPTSLAYRLIVLVAIALAVLSAHLLFNFVEERARKTMRRLLPRSMNV